MKNYLLQYSLAGLLLAGCATQESKLVLDPVGPAVRQAESDKASGKLMVYTTFDPRASFSTTDQDKGHFSDYRILTSEGTFLKRVHNDTAGILEEPAEVMLPAGSYQIVARSNGYGLVTVPIVIAANQTTAVHLEGGSWGGKEVQNSANVVKLPNGQIIGWKSASAVKANR